MFCQKNMDVNIKKDILDLNSIQYIDLAITANCILQCKMCHIWKNGKFAEELTLNEWKRFISSLANIPGITRQIDFSGGEPLMKDGLLDLVFFCSAQGFKVSMATNAYLIDEAAAKRIAESGLERINISLDSLDENVHDYLRGVKGTYKRLMAAIAYLEKYCGGIDIAFCAVISGKNLKGLANLVNWVQKNEKFIGINLQAIQQPFNTSLDSEWFKKSNYAELWPKDVEEVCHVLDDLVELKKNKGRLFNSISQLQMFKEYFASPLNFIKQLKCNVGQNAFQVNHLGHVKVCYFEEPIGNIRDDSISRIFAGEKAQRLRAKMSNCKDNCHFIVNCRYDEE